MADQKAASPAVPDAGAAAPVVADGKGDKGRGKGKRSLGGPAGKPPPSTGKPKVKAQPKKPIPEGGGGMAEMLARVKKTGEEMDAKYEAVWEECPDAVPREKAVTFKCPRCEQDIPEMLRESHMNSHSSKILDWLYLGGNGNANNVKELTVRTGITHILNMAAEINQDHIAKQEWKQYNEEHNTSRLYLKISWRDEKDQDVCKEVETPVEFIAAVHEENKNNKVLVHCVQGISRSATVCIVYLMMKENMSLKEAYTVCKEARPIMEPRYEFLEAMGRWEMQRNPSLKEPTLLAADVYKGKTMLNLDEDHILDAKRLLEEKKKKEASGEDSLTRRGSFWSYIGAAVCTSRT